VDLKDKSMAEQQISVTEKDLPYRNPTRSNIFSELGEAFIPGIDKKHKREYTESIGGFLNNVSTDMLESGMTVAQFLSRASYAGYDLADPTIMQYAERIKEIQNQSVGGYVPSQGTAADPLSAMMGNGGEPQTPIKLESSGNPGVDYAAANLQLTAQGLDKTEAGKSTLELLKANKALKDEQDKAQREALSDIAKTVIGEQSKNLNPVFQMEGKNVATSPKSIGDFINGSGTSSIGWEKKTALPPTKHISESTSKSYNMTPNAGGTGSGTAPKTSTVSWGRAVQIGTQINQLRMKADGESYDPTLESKLITEQNAYQYIGDALEREGVDQDTALKTAQKSVGLVGYSAGGSAWIQQGRVLNMADPLTASQVVTAIKSGYSVAEYIAEKVRQEAEEVKVFPVPRYIPPNYGYQE